MYSGLNVYIDFHHGKIKSNRTLAWNFEIVEIMEVLVRYIFFKFISGIQIKFVKSFV